MRPSSGNPQAAWGSLPKNVAGLVNNLHWAMVFIDWASSLRRPPTVAMIRNRFEVSRATAYRYLAAYEAVFGARRLLPREDNSHA